MISDLAAALAEHRAAPFPPVVKRGEDYGSVCAVMIDADIFGWASRAAEGELLSPQERTRFARAADRLRSSLQEFPTAGRSYYERLLAIAELAIECLEA
jgi:hypothetical protein